ncbi:sensor histidine kinase RegB [Haematobacter genomosp. 1]|uniref:histidine kinase n=1 Tax=Haematobacter genomosp. 1 TaxID=366618 RepID=A0A212AGK8_9RHOB|nr:ActS/PrrB/RegB family redox-sensitive histidine kinase [Haematobacter genomosp. 1]OWJ80642.1 two-component sensor histidine kinase [Haematobacter genomosp. 1]
MTLTDLFPDPPESAAERPLRLRTLVLLRWMAVTGQFIALMVAERYFGLLLPTGWAIAAILAMVAVNVVTMLGFPKNRRLTDREAMLTLLVDTSQYGLLLYLTGGIHNPFALLILAPVTISATSLRLSSTIVLAVVAIALVTLVEFRSIPMRFADGSPVVLPPIYRFGNWLAILIGILFIGLYTHRVASEARAMSRALLATQMALAREQKLTDLGGVVAAAAHELGTPLATIKLVSSELLEEVGDDPDLMADVTLIRDQADRCRDILRSMGRAGKDDMHLRNAPVEAVLREAAEPHAGRGKAVRFVMESGDGSPQPMIRRRPELIHGLRNLVQNAVDFSRTGVVITAIWSRDSLRITIVDDGPGYPPHLLGRIGEPFLRRRRDEPDPERPGYEGMGLGLFIAKTLLERTGGTLRFTNAPEGGAVIAARWPLAALAAEAGPLGDNPMFEA